MKYFWKYLNEHISSYCVVCNLFQAGDFFNSSDFCKRAMVELVIGLMCYRNIVGVILL